MPVGHKSRGRSVPVASAPSCLAALLVHLRPSPSRKVLHTARDRRSEPGLPHEPAIVTSIEHALTRRTCARVDSSVHAPSLSRLAARARIPSLGLIRVRTQYARRSRVVSIPKDASYDAASFTCTEAPEKQQMHLHQQAALDFGAFWFLPSAVRWSPSTTSRVRRQAAAREKSLWLARARAGASAEPSSCSSAAAIDPRARPWLGRVQSVWRSPDSCSREFLKCARSARRCAV